VRPTFTLLLLATVLGCAAPPPPRRSAPLPVSARRPGGGSSALDDTLRRELANDHAFPWSATRPLTWSDFQGRPPAGGPEGAKTAYSLSSIWKCRGQTFEFRVVAAFRPRQSWVKAAVLKDSLQRRTILAHEQTHFDLAEVQARKMRQVFGDLPGPCRRSDRQLSALAERLGREENAEQRRYDAETHHGLLTAPQAEWTRSTRQRLAESR